MIQLLVGYTMVKYPGTDEFFGEMRKSIEAPANYKDPAKIQEYKDKKFQELQEEAFKMPYLGTFGSVHLLDTSTPPEPTLHKWSSEKRQPFGKDKPLSALIASFLKSKWPDAFEEQFSVEHKVSEIILVGFEIRRFVKMLGLECSMPGIECPLPGILWYGSHAYRDVSEMIIPKDVKLDKFLPFVLKCRGLSVKENWKGPCEDAATDLRLTTELLTQLKFLRKPIAE